MDLRAPRNKLFFDLFVIGYKTGGLKLWKKDYDRVVDMAKGGTLLVFFKSLHLM